MASDINDLPATSPHGSDFGHHPQILGLASDLSATRGTVTAHRDECCDTPFHRLEDNFRTFLTPGGRFERSETRDSESKLF